MFKLQERIPNDYAHGKFSNVPSFIGKCMKF